MTCSDCQSAYEQGYKHGRMFGGGSVISRGRKRTWWQRCQRWLRRRS